jgi:hypothetical protein
MRLLLPKLLNTVGTLLIAYAALRVHHRVLNDQKVDRSVLKEMRREQVAGIFGTILIVVSFFLDVMLLY